MKKLIAAIITFLGFSTTIASAGNLSLDYDKLIHLDAEDLAEAGIKDAYESIMGPLGSPIKGQVTH